MKILSLVILLCLSFSTFSQVSVGPVHSGKGKKFDKGVLEKFKNTKTIFVLSEILDRAQYLEILEDSWEVTPYQIVHIGDFNIEEYLDDKYSIAKLGGFLRTTSMGNGSYTSLFTYIDFKMYDGEKISKKLDKLSPKKREKRKMEIIEENSIDFARVYIFPKDEFIHTTMSKGMDTIFRSLYLDDVFFNYKPGYLKNYFQKVSISIGNEEEYWMYGNDSQPELKNLSSATLYIPSYLTIKYNGWTGKDSEPDEENIEDIFKKYDYSYEIIDDAELSNKIMDDEELYYLRFVRMNTERFLQIVNSKNGEIVYRDYIPGLSYKLKSKHIKDLNQDIKKAGRK